MQQTNAPQKLQCLKYYYVPVRKINNNSPPLLPQPTKHPLTIFPVRPKWKSQNKIEKTINTKKNEGQKQKSSRMKKSRQHHIICTRLDEMQDATQNNSKYYTAKEIGSQFNPYILMRTSPQKYNNTNETHKINQYPELLAILLYCIKNRTISFII